MPTEIVWNEAAPPRNTEDHSAAAWLATIARCVCLCEVTEANESEWLWRFAFMQMLNPWCRTASGDTEKFLQVLRRFRTVTLVGRVCEASRADFVREYVEHLVENASDEATDMVADLLQEVAT